MNDTIHGYQIITTFRPLAVVAGIRPGRIILVDCGKTNPRWVTAWLGDGDTEWWQGDYHRDLDSALASFDRRVKPARELWLESLKPPVTDEETRRKRSEDFNFMVVCAAKGNMDMYELLRDRDVK